MVKTGTDHFWDGGIVSNTPLQYLDQDEKLSSLILQIDLFSARDVPPPDLQDLPGRHKDIMYSSRKRHNAVVNRGIQTWKKRLNLALEKSLEERLCDEECKLREEGAKRLRGSLQGTRIFSGTSAREHWQSGCEDTKRTLPAKMVPMPSSGAGIVVHQHTQGPVSIIFQHLADTLKSTGVAKWYM